MPGFRVVGYDANGTIFNDNTQFVNTANGVLISFGKPTMEASALLTGFRQPSSSIFRKAGITEEEASHDDLHRVYNELYVKQSRAKPFKGVKSTLKWLKDRDIKLAIVTAQKEEIIAPLLAEYDLLNMFDYCNYGVENKAEVLRNLCRHFYLRYHRQMIYVGDQMDDVRHARDAGCFSVGFGGGMHTFDMLWKEAGCDMYIREHSSIKTLFR